MRGVRFLRSKGFTCLLVKVNSSSMLSMAVSGVDSHSSPSFVVVCLHQSKADTAGVGAQPQSRESFCVFGLR